ncbi:MULTISPECIES: GNAT family N-acetyltransferase [Mammaliicoccus]|uniref:GNAT family N-acetyltransferase n=2 Tax=Mammaliicoccus vitulinus TaxID=71237 RepID=A0A2T4PRV2_9STAP|nr:MULTISPECIES: GNAT family N-acetyltransferase [Mammaliicoccus]PTI28934.1 GNAT family N-acetyltransferase [Mammaliicoccus vitulinus]PTI36373.1 GNAT family N-acetyltransferase [Mammaliicoccus vitulinus]PTI70845.1 GNAT family N-acetyltransferase [Mammaliicoccus vitulinus]PTI88917.1 GNAT family N-acetyltransferase [Mammaliicoccus vitulinus]QQT14449.1 GNAT family N-acetyltransferase [Mammaliicoccus vitulinus]
MIRPAQKHDAKKLSELMYIIWHDMELPIVVNNDKDTVLKVIEQSMVEGNYRNHFKHIHIFEVEGELAGFINCYAGDDELQLEKNWHDIHFDQTFILEGTPLSEQEAESGDLYIESIAVFSKFRGRGIASKLIDYTFNHAKSLGFNQVSLNCEVDNEGAMKLYQKLGFEPSHDKVLSGHDYKYMVKAV